MRNRRRTIYDRSKGKFINRDKLKLFPLIFASIILVAGTYAWFTFYSDVDSTMSGHVVSWKIDFNGKEVSEDIEVEIANISPGMDEFKSDISVANSGEVDAKVSAVVKKIKVFDEEYEVGTIVDGNALTVESLANLIENKFPFTIGFTVTNPVIKKGEVATLDLNMNWPYETFRKVLEDDTFNVDYEYYKLNPLYSAGSTSESKYKLDTTISSTNFDTYKSDLYYTDDATDTKWGQDAYTWRTTKPTEPSIVLTVQLVAVQNVE